MNIRILLIEPDAADASFVQDVLLEMSGGDFWHGWVAFETIHAASWDEAVSVLANDAIDIILLAPTSSEEGLLMRFRSLDALAPGTPVVLLTAAEDRPLAVTLLREGAQDVLLKRDLDCKPLAHAMSHALERQRFVAAARAACLRDASTGLLNRDGFLLLAGRDLSLAERLGQRLLLLAAEPRGAGSGRHNDLVVTEASEHLQTLVSSGDLLARVSPARFALAIFGGAGETAERAWTRVASAARERAIATTGAIFDPRHPVSIETLLGEAELDLARLSFVPAAHRETALAHGAARM